MERTITQIRKDLITSMTSNLSSDNSTNLEKELFFDEIINSFDNSSQNFSKMLERIKPVYDKILEENKKVGLNGKKVIEFKITMYSEEIGNKFPYEDQLSKMVMRIGGICSFSERNYDSDSRSSDNFITIKLL